MVEKERKISEELRNFSHPGWWNEFWGSIGNVCEKAEWRSSVYVSADESPQLEKMFRDAVRDLVEKTKVFSQKLEEEDGDFGMR